ncbi:hypothetical protein ACFX43_04650 [Nocardioides sp. YIM B13467]|uniref:hypothetical protein n=1 Tax=Nocardioides sp. YIM B13467 TaxID=3366294 RepID=UPI00367157BD
MGSMEDQRSKAATVHELNGVLRGLVLLTGLCGLAAGGMAVFTSNNQAGTVGLLVVGAVAMLLAIVGRVPLRWVIGGNEFDMTKEAEAAEVMTEVVASELSPTATRAVADRLMQSDTTRGTSATYAMLNWVAFETNAIGRVTGAVTSRPRWTFTVASDQEGDHEGLDGTVRDPNGRYVGVEFKLARNQSDFARWFNRLQPASLARPIVLVVSSLSSLSMASRDYLEHQSQLGMVEVVGLEDPDFERRFLAACDKLLDNAS